MSDRLEDTTALDGDESEQSDTDSRRGRATSNRRQFIALGAGATTVLLAGCSSGDDGNGGDNDSENGGSNGGENGGENGGGNGGGDPESAELAVSSLDIAGQGEEATVQSGSDNEVAVTVENVGEQSDSFDVTLSASGVSRSQTVELGGGESQTLTFEGLLSELEAGTQSSFSVAAGGEEVSGEVDAAVTVEEPGEPAMPALSGLDIAGQGADATVEPGAEGVISVTIENVGGQTGSFQYTLTTDDGVFRPMQTFGIAPGEAQEFTFDDVLPELQPGTREIVITAGDAEISGAVTVGDGDSAQPATPALSGLDIAGQGPDATVEGGSDGAVTVTVENVGEQSSSFDVTLSADSVSESQTVELAGGESQTVTFEGAIAALESGTSGLTVAAGDTEIGGQVTVGGSTTDAEEFRSQFTGGTAYRFEITSSQGTVTGRFRDGNQYLELQGGQAAGEFYLVDETVYSVQRGECFVIPSAPVNTTQPPEEAEVDDANFSSVTRVGTDTIDGEEVIVYEVSATNFGPGDATYYLLADTGRLRRMVFESQQGEQQIDFFAWGDDVEPITPPDMNCRNPGSTR